MVVIPNHIHGILWIDKDDAVGTPLLHIRKHNHSFTITYANIVRTNPTIAYKIPFFPLEIFFFTPASVYNLTKNILSTQNDYVVVYKYLQHEKQLVFP